MTLSKEKYSVRLAFTDGNHTEMPLTYLGRVLVFYFVFYCYSKVPEAACSKSKISWTYLLQPCLNFNMNNSIMVEAQTRSGQMVKCESFNTDSQL